MREFLLQREQWIPRPIEEAFAFFADAKNLETITPHWLNFAIRSPEPIVMRSGATIEYRLRWRRFPLLWVTQINEWEPPHHFGDTQIRGPYVLWHHTHEFEPHASRTRMRDRVRYVLPLGVLGTLMHRLLVRRDLEAVFDYRARRVNEIFGPGAEHVLV